MKDQFDPFLAMINGAMAKVSEERKANAENMRLGSFIDELEKCNPDLPIVVDEGGSVDHFTSYRGYYEDLCITPTHEVRTVGHILQHARKALGEMFEGYKGGDFWMTKNTLLWVADYGCTGRKLVGVTPEEIRVVIETAEDHL